MKNVGVLFIMVFAFSISAHSAEIYGIFMVVKGDVKVQKPDKQTATAKVSAKVFPGDTIITGAASRAKVTMSDHNVISVSPNSIFTINAYSNDGKNRNVELELKAGKVRNDVKNTYDNDKNKFIIKTPTAVAGVRGTDFITSYNVKTKITEIVTLKGEVMLSNLTGGAGIPAMAVSVKKGESSSVNNDQPPVPPKPVAPDQMKDIDADTNASAPKKDGGKPAADANGGSAPPVAGAAPGTDAGKGDGKGDGKGKDTSVGTAPVQPPPNRIDDKDQSPDTFEKLPENRGGKKVNTGPIFRPPPPPGKNYVGDAITNKTDKTKVIINPTPQGTQNNSIQPNTITQPPAGSH